MHPALSIVLFTTLSGAGYGLLAWLGILSAAGLLPNDRLFGFVSMALALGAVSIGLVASTFHLGHPERAWRAFSQWRSSWLSREGVAAVFTYLPAVIFAAGWVLLARTDGAWRWAGLATALGALVTIVCTAYIYRSLKPIPHWHNNWVVPNFLSLSAMTGALWLAALAKMFGLLPMAAAILALIAIPVALVLKLAYWRHVDRASVASTPETATGLGHLGKVRLFSAPHTAENYLMKEMGFRIARKHAAKLRRIALLCAFVLPFALIVVGLLVPQPVAAALTILAAALATLGVLVERWLFFAEAKHAVTLYYGGTLAPAESNT